MDDALRLDYLDAMGITTYVARRPLPGALPSPVAEALPVGAPPDTASDATASSRLTSGPTALLDAWRAESASGQPPLRKPDASGATPPVALPAQAQAPTALYQCRLAIWTVGDLLVLADAPRLDNSQLNLLRNILPAIGRHAPLSETRQFVWPIAQRKDKTLTAAREHFQGLLDGGLLQHPGLRQILCFGRHMAPLLQTGDGEPPAADTPDSVAMPTQYHDWPVISACALHDMLGEPARKAETWRAIRVLVPQ